MEPRTIPGLGLKLRDALDIPEGPIRVPLWNWAPKTIPYMVWFLGPDSIMAL